MTENKQPTPNDFFVNITDDLLHNGTPEYVHRLLDANRDFGNGIADHILTCRRCQRKLMEMVTK